MSAVKYFLFDWLTRDCGAKLYSTAYWWHCCNLYTWRDIFLPTMHQRKVKKIHTF